jgi:uncharacterized protein YgbK (DUF1537 family)
MSNPQGTMSFNAPSISNLASTMSACPTCDALQAQVNSTMASLQGISTGLTAQLAQANAMLALLSPPAANPSAIVGWINKMITAQVKPYTDSIPTLTVQIAQFSAEVANLTAAINSAAGAIPGCSVTVPPITLPTP